MTPMDSLNGHLVLVRGEVARKDNPIVPAEQTHSACISSEPDEFDIVDLYAVGHVQKKKDTVPFIHLISLEGPKGEVVHIRELFDDGVLVNVLCSSVFDNIKKHLGSGVNSKWQLRMANGSIVPSKDHWEGPVNLGGIRTTIAFEVFNSGGNWAFLFGKPSLEAFKAIHDYKNDTISITGIGGSTTVRNQVQYPHYARISRVAGVNLALDIKQYKPEWFIHETSTVETATETTTETGMANSAYSGKRGQRKSKSVRRARQRLRRKTAVLARTPKVRFVGGQRWMGKRTKDRATKKDSPQTSKAKPADQEPSTPICIVTDDEHIQISEPGTEIPTEGLNANKLLYTCHMDAFNPERVRAVLDTLTLGPNLTENQRKKANDLITEFADCFALAVSEVTQVPGAVHHLNILDNVKFSNKVHQHPLTPPQHQYLNKKIDKMLEACVVIP